VTVVVVSTFRAHEGKVQQTVAVLTELVERAHDEPGCLTYALHRDPTDPRTMVIVGRWTSKIALESHFQQPYLRAIGDRGAELLEASPTLHVLEPVALGDPMKGSL
jgi:quinol monooxygenase YgiN